MRQTDVFVTVKEVVDVNKLDAKELDENKKEPSTQIPPYEIFLSF